MKKVRFALLACLVAATASIGAAPGIPPAAPARTAALSLMPLPSSMQAGNGWLELRTDFRAALVGYSEPRLERAVHRLYRRLRAQTGLRFPRRLTDPAWEAARLPTANGTAVLEIEVSGPGESVQSIDTDESYVLVVTGERACLTAPTPIGALRGLETFLQLVAPNDAGFGIQALLIEDAPRYPWRGLLIDTGRMFLPLETLLRTLDGMAAVKLNVLHWHLIEDQGFRVESKAFPRLHELGSDGSYYSQAEVRQVVAHARDLGIRVVPEIDIPGHTSSWFVGHPELASAPGPYELDHTWGVKDPVLDPTRDEVYEFLDVLLGEMAALFPDATFHIGGDEVNGVQWDTSPAIQAFMAEHGMVDSGDLQAYFNQRTSTILTEHGKEMMGWDEVLHPDLPLNTIVQSWRGPTALAAAARRGYRGVLSHGYYLDLYHSAESHYGIDPGGGDAADLPADVAARILGGEACMWGEMATAENVDSRIWPRAAAIAERLWSPPDTTDVDDMYRRLDALSQHLEWLGLQHTIDYRLMLQRLAGYRSIEALRHVADVLEPVKNYDRHWDDHEWTYGTHTSMNRMVDTVRPESAAARRLTNRVGAYLSTPTPALAVALRARLDDLRRHALTAIDELDDAPLVHEVQPLFADVATLAVIAAATLDYLESGAEPPPGWTARRLELIGAAAQPRAELTIAIAPTVRILVEALSRTP